jgi:hypothetical protein
MTNIKKWQTLKNLKLNATTLFGARIGIWNLIFGNFIRE